ncbi:hypothetical protein SLEP1_g56229 [Rubroshorea leprosula]|uniref:Uncharacterized protein n=1 Tax=Rubroshorea leprosula TaxID=152421 RepID=A0AAV5MHQ4_9ROSI|nr:hypothetical protein SLEP1_g56229 [Rubroshorea leprosula]
MFHLLFSIKKHPKPPNYEDDDNIGSYQAVINPFDEVEEVNPFFVNLLFFSNLQDFF